MVKAMLALLVTTAVVVCLVGCGGDSVVNSGVGGDVDTTLDLYMGKKTVLGGKTWMAENLNIATADSWCYGEDGSKVYVGQGGYVTISNNEVQANCAKYGRLYTWQAAKSACQSIGWRLPNMTDLKRLMETAGDSITAGSKLKSRNGWYDWDGNEIEYGTDEYGFSALPGGSHDINGIFGGIGHVGAWWMATGDGSIYTYGGVVLMAAETDAIFYGTVKDAEDAGIIDIVVGLDKVGLSARCVKD
jgi:uncharacterized protein (TIGR02145 family)